MPEYLATVKMPYTTGLARDLAETTTSWKHLPGTPDDEAAADLIIARLMSFWNATGPEEGASPMNYIGAVVDRLLCNIRIDRIDENGPADPVVTWIKDSTAGSGWDGVAGDSSSLPLEVAAVVSFITDDPPRPIGRRRGRFYVGPLNTFAIEEDVNLYPLLADHLVLNLASACQTMAELNGTDDLLWCVWSRADGTLTDVHRGFVNNEPDTQRRRGVDATSREIWVAA